MGDARQSQVLQRIYIPLQKNLRIDLALILEISPVQVLHEDQDISYMILT